VTINIDHFQNSCVSIISSPRNRQIPVFIVNGSLNNKDDITVNTITPIPNPISREGHICPSNAKTKCFTDCININEIGIPINKANHKLSFKKSYFNLPCN
jgi:hypothetical protein